MFVAVTESLETCHDCTESNARKNVSTKLQRHKAQSHENVCSWILPLLRQYASVVGNTGW